MLEFSLINLVLGFFYRSFEVQPCQLVINVINFWLFSHYDLFHLAGCFSQITPEESWLSFDQDARSLHNKVGF